MSPIPVSSTHTTAKYRRGVRQLLLCSLLVFPVFITGCSIGEKIDKVTDTVTDVTGDTIAALDNAIDTLDRNSASWQAVLQDTTSKLTKDAQSTVRNEVSDLLNRSVAATGGELRCNMDFVGARVRQALARIRARLLHQEVPPVEPALCQVVPAAVDMTLDPGRRTKLEFFGYDFDTTPIKVTLHEGSNKRNVTSELDRLTHYHMTLNLGGNGVPLSKSSDRLTLEWQNRTISSIAVIQPTTPVCREKDHTEPPRTYLSFTPPHTRGDKDFFGHGPEVWANARWINEGTHVNFRLWMKAQETKKDWSTAEGERVIQYYTAPPGWRIDRIVSGMESTAHYIDTDHSDDRLGGGPNGPVKEFVFRGDRRGDEAGSHTGVDVTFNPLVLKLVEVANCAPASAVRSLEIKDLISPATAKRMKKMMDTLHR